MPLSNKDLASANQEQSFFSRNKKLLIILTLSVIALVVVGTLIMPRLPFLHQVDIECQRLAKDIKKDVIQANYCDQDSDCSVIRSPDCQFYLVNIAKLASVNQRIADYYISCGAPNKACTEDIPESECANNQCVLKPSGDTPPTPPEPLTSDKGLINDIKNAKGIAWVGPHCDDDMSVAGALALASLEYKKNTYVVSLKSAPGVDWVAPEVRFQDNEDFKNFLHLQEYFRWHIEKIPDPEKKQALFDFLDSHLQQRNIELLLTFEPTNGYYGHGDHKMVGKWLTEYVKGKNIKLYYVLNLDPAVKDIWPGSHNDPEPYSDIIKLEEYQANSYLGKATLWDTKVEVLKIYESSVQAASRFLENLSKFQRYEYYRKVQ